MVLATVIMIINYDRKQVGSQFFSKLLQYAGCLTRTNTLAMEY